MAQSIDVNEFLDLVREPLAQGDAEALAQTVRVRWRPRQLCGLMRHPQNHVRQVAAVALGLVGDKTCVGCLSRALHDDDPQVNQMAEHALWSIWFRGGSPRAAGVFREGVAKLAAEQYAEAAERFHAASRIDPQFAEAYNQCAIAHFFLRQWHESIADCRRAVQLVPTHFGAIAGMGHCYTHLGQMEKALECYHQALHINPRMPAIASAVRRLEARLRDQLDNSGQFDMTHLLR